MNTIDRNININEASAELRRPSVALHRLVLIFKGGDCILAEEA